MKLTQLTTHTLKQEGKIAGRQKRGDLLVLCANSADLHEATGHLRRILKPSGLKLKEEKSRQANLNSEAMTISYMSFVIQLVDNRAVMTIDNALCNSLALRLQKVVEQSEEVVLIKRIITGWISYLGPAAYYMSRDERADVIDRIRKMAAQIVGHSADLPQNELLSRLHRAAQQWQKIRSKVGQ